MKRKYEAVVLCENGHETTTWITPLVIEAGVLKRGIMGSSADFCDTCDGVVIETLRVQEVK